MRRLLIAAVLASGLALTLTACSTSSSAGNTPPPAADPVALVSASAAAIDTTPSHQAVTIDTSLGNLAFVADTDPANKVVFVKISGLLDAELRAVGTDLWINTAGLPKPWVHLDVTKLPEGSRARNELDLKSNFGILAGITEAKEVGPGHFEARSDLNKAKAALTSTTARDAVQDLIDLAGGSAGSVPLKATLDDQHRLVELTFSITSAKTGATSSSKVVVSDYGRPVAATRPPAGDVAEATAEMYSLF